MRYAFPLAILALAASACSSDASAPPANVAGTYTVAVTSRQNACRFSNWNEGQSSTGIGFTVTQSGASATGVVDGLTGAFVDLWLGTKTFAGNVSGATATMTAVGTREHRAGTCPYKIDGIITGTLTGDALQGTIRYTARTNKTPDCATIEGCISQQDFSGSRPPPR